MVEPLINLHNPAVQRMLRLVKQRGYVTRRELHQVLPPAEFSAEQVQSVVDLRSHMGIQVLED